MATATLTGKLASFTRSFSNLPNPVLRVHPVGSATVDGHFLADRPLRINLTEDGEFSVLLETGQRYFLEAHWTDDYGNRLGRSVTDIFRMPTGGGDVGDIIGPPAASGMVRVLRTPPPSSLTDQYAYDETTGDLYERRA